MHRVPIFVAAADPESQARAKKQPHMRAAPPRSDEAAGIEALARGDLLDSGPNALVRVASLACGVSIALVSLIDQDRQWFKANEGLGGVMPTPTPRVVVFCARAVLDSKCSRCPMPCRTRVSPTTLRSRAIPVSNAGVLPRLSSGHVVGTLCVVNRQPRRLSAAQRELLRYLALATAQALESWHACHLAQQAVVDAASAAQELKRSEAGFRALSDGSPLGVHRADASGACGVQRRALLAAACCNLRGIPRPCCLAGLAPRPTELVVGYARSAESRRSWRAAHGRQRSARRTGDDAGCVRTQFG
jgi:hypothetical protein